MRYDPSTETFNDYLNKFSKEAKQAFRDKSSDITETFFFAKLPVQKQNELAMSGKHDTTMEEIRTFVQRRCQYAQLLPNTVGAQPFNQMSAPQPNAATPQTSNTQSTNITGKQRESWMDKAVTASYMGTKRRSVRNASDKKHRQNPQTRNNNRQPNRTRPKKTVLNTSQNSFVNFVARWDTQPETVITEIRPHQPTKTSRILNSQRKKTNSSEGLFDRPTTGLSTIQGYLQYQRAVPHYQRRN